MRLGLRAWRRRLAGADDSQPGRDAGARLYAADIMRQYMAKADSPTWGRDASSHFGDFEKRNVCAPISMLGELIGVMAGVCLGARLQGKNVVGLTYVGDGGQSTGVTYESLKAISERRFRMLADSAPVGIFELARGMRVTYANAEGCGCSATV